MNFEIRTEDRRKRMKLGDLAAIVVYWAVVILFFTWAIRTLSSDPNFLPFLAVASIIGAGGIVFLSLRVR